MQDAEKENPGRVVWKEQNQRTLRSILTEFDIREYQAILKEISNIIDQNKPLINVTKLLLEKSEKSTKVDSNSRKQKNPEIGRAKLKVDSEMKLKKKRNSEIKVSKKENRISQKLYEDTYISIFDEPKDFSSHSSIFLDYYRTRGNDRRKYFMRKFNKQIKNIRAPKIPKVYLENEKDEDNVKECLKNSLEYLK